MARLPTRRCSWPAIRARRYRESVDSVRDIVAGTPPPPGVKAYVTGAAPLFADQLSVGSKGIAKVTLITIGGHHHVADHLPIGSGRPRVMYRHHRIDLGPWHCRPTGEFRDHRAVDVRDESAYVAGHRGGHGLRDIPAGPLPRSTPRRRGPRNRLLHHVTAARVILGSGLTVAGAVFCLSFARLPYFHSMGAPGAIGVRSRWRPRLPWPPPC